VPEDLAVDVSGLTKRFGSRVTAVRGLDLSVRRGETYGLLGPNAAGKTTTLRMLLGLVKPDAGTIRVLGRTPGSPAALAQIGAMGETAFYPFLSGRDNVRAVARRCRLPDARVDAVLDLVGLTVRAGDRVSGYSLGMAQRLAVAVALLKDPELLILDEPCNGLDPGGQLEMRTLIRNLAVAGRTILLSSHDMSEVEELCGRVAVIGGGRVLAQGTPEQLRGHPQLWVHAQPVAQGAAVASRLPGLQKIDRAGERLCLTLADPEPNQAAQVNRSLVEAGLDVSELRTLRRPLRDVFLDLTGGRSGGADSLAAPGEGPWRRRWRRGRAA
jgi:ABC-2 type transport system ATP-binding protein